MSHICRKWFVLQLTMLVLCASSHGGESASQGVKLTSIQPVFFTEASGAPEFDQTSDGKTLQLGNRQFDFGVSVAGTSEITYILNGRFAHFDAWAGIDENMPHDGKHTAIFQVFGDGKKLFDSGPMNSATSPRHIGLDVSEIRELQLTAVNGGTGRVGRADWAQPILIPAKSFKIDKAGKPVYEIRGGNLALKLDSGGEIAGLEIGSGKCELTLTGGTRLVQCRQEQPPQVEKLPDGGISVVRIAEDQNGNKVSVTDRFTPTANSIRWDVDIFGDGKPWSTAIVTGLRWPVSRDTRFWTAWSDPDLAERGGPGKQTRNLSWHDPLEMKPFADSARWYGGNPTMSVPMTGDYFSIPIITISELDNDAGFSFVESPEDTVLHMQLITTANGRVEFQHRYHRLGNNQHVRFSMDLVGHAADWRSGLAWMTKRYPDFFEPAVPLAGALGGCGAYSMWEGDVDADKFRKMAFSFNWKASFDFPYMGMFLPPVDNWETYGAIVLKGRPVSAQRTYGRTSKVELNEYSRRMRDHGFHVLNYFNATEFGAQVKQPANVDWSVPDQDVWTNCTDFLYRKIADAILYSETSNRFRSWGGAVVMDCGAKDYQDFLLEQAQSHIDLLPESSGICIDRMDWLRLFNPRADDGISWYDDKPARSLYVSWTELMSKLGPMMHRNGKVIFVNPLVSMRLDMLHESDGIYSEHNESGPGLDASALLGLFRPIVAWTWADDLPQIGPDKFFQRLLYLGVFPTAPFPGNNHSILPSEYADQWYLAYGPLFEQLKGRKWVLDPNVISVSGGAAKANIFEVPDGYAIPVVMADEGVSTVRVVLKSPERFLSDVFTIDALQPGINEPVAVKVNRKLNKLILDIPVHDGCAMVRLKKQR